MNLNGSVIVTREFPKVKPTPLQQKKDNFLYKNLSPSFAIT